MMDYMFNVIYLLILYRIGSSEISQKGSLTGAARRVLTALCGSKDEKMENSRMFFIHAAAGAGNRDEQRF